MHTETRDARFAEAWADYRRRRRTFWALLLGGVPGIGGVLVLGGLSLSALGFSGSRPVGRVFGYFASLLMAAWFVAGVVTGFRLGAWRCPRCRHHYFRSDLVNNPFARRCMHCGLRLWEGENAPAVSGGAVADKA